MSQKNNKSTSSNTAGIHQSSVRTSLQVKMTLWSGLLLSVLSIILVAYSVITLRQTAINDAENEALAIAGTHAQQIRAELDLPLLTARTLANALESIKSPTNPTSMTRDQVNAMLRQVLSENPSFLGTDTLWEPNAFDGLDAEYRGKPGHDETGRFIPYWVRGNDGSIHVEALVDYETPGVGDWYLQPRNTKKEYTVAPYIYSIQGVDTVMATFTVPIIVNDKFYGIAGVDAPIAFTQDIVNGISLYGDNAKAVLLTDNGTLIAVHNQPELSNQPATQIYQDFEQLQPRLTAGEVFTSLSPDGKYLRVFSPIDIGEVGTHWSFSLIIPFNEITATATAAAIRQAGISVGLIALALFVLWFLNGQVVRPIRELTNAARAVSEGNLNVTAETKSSDETGILASAFNSMTARLRELIVTLEQRVADRTNALTTSSEVSRRLSTILNQKELVREVVNQVKNAFGYYHAQIYFYDETAENLVMAGGTGEVGEMMLAQFHKVAKGRGLVGSAAETNKSVLVSNTLQNAEWLPNKLLPETKSEAAIPISIGDQVLGVLDVQHNIVNGLRQEDMDSLQSIANQIAVALQNIQSTEIVTKRAAELQTVSRISTVAATIGDIQKMLESVVHLTQRGFGLYHAHVFTFNESLESLEIVACGWQEGDEHEGTHGATAIPLDQEQSLVARAARTRQAVIVNNVHSDPGWLPNPLLPDTASEMAVPMIVGNQLLGVLDVQSARLNAFTDEDASIQTTLASQVATALQNARSFTTTQHQAERETSVNLITQKIQSTTSIEAALQITARELGHALGMKSTTVTLDPEALASERKGN